MKKNLLMSALVFGSLGLSASATASCVVELQYQGSILGQNVFEGSSCREALKQCKRIEKRYERDHLLPNEELSCVNLGGSQDPIPDPTPDPDPIPYPDPTPSYGISVTGFIEGSSIQLNGYSTTEVFNNCLDMVESRGMRSVDQMMISVNGHKYQNIRNSSSYWNTAESICNQIDRQLTSENLGPVRPELYPITVSGTIEDSSVVYTGNSLDEVYNSCVLDVKSRRISRVDQMLITVNGHKYESLRNSSSYWNTPTSICNQVDRQVNSFRLTPVYPTGYLNAEGRMEGTTFSLRAESVDELYNACVEFVIGRRVSRVDDIYISINNSRRERIRNSSSYWSTPISICNATLRNIL